MSWVNKRIEEVAQIIDGDRGKNYPSQNEFYDEGYCLFLNTGNVTVEGFRFDKCQFVSKEKDSLLRKGKLQRGDIVYTTRGTVGNAGYYGGAVPYDNIRINSGMVVLRAYREIADERFLYQLIKSKYQKDRIKSHITGSAQPQLPIKNMSQIQILLPPIETQKRIADILSAYDDLIENNQKQIKLLEEAAMRLYQEWFVKLRFPGHETAKIVDGVPEGWTFKRVNDVCQLIRRGISPKYSDKGASLVINQKCIRNRNVNLALSRRQEKIYPEELSLRDGDIAICSTGEGTLGRVGQINIDLPDCTFDSHVTLVRAVETFGVNYLGWFLATQESYFVSMGKGSTNQKELSRGVIESLEILVPSQIVIDTFERYQQKYRDAIRICNQQIVLLRQARDKLLPKLMSCEIEV